MHLISLDKKLWQVAHRLDLTQLKEIEEKHSLTKEVVQQQIQRELFIKFSEGIAKSIPTQVTVLPDKSEEYKISGYVLTQLNMMELIKECLEMDELGKEKFLVEITKAITYRSNNVK